ncbi:hypothetical protein ANO11243_075710 [Dothideomycetidae sp. 11243]|nr:hypothetical protein ANO11243_075710 [fungal sp. No.11243]
MRSQALSRTLVATAALATTILVLGLVWRPRWSDAGFLRHLAEPIIVHNSSRSNDTSHGMSQDVVHDTSHSTSTLCTVATLSAVAVADGWYPAQTAIGMFSPGTIESSGRNYTRGVAMARLRSESVDWLHEVGPEIERYVYVVDDAGSELTVPENKGHEAMVYLTYIIDHYDSLPDVTMFMHAHRWADHNDPMLDRDAVEMIRRLDTERVIYEGYVNLNCNHYPGCPGIGSGERRLYYDALLDIYARIFPDRGHPREISTPCCAQFAVSRDRIRSTPLEQYISYRGWLLQTKLEDYESGRVWEFLWHVIFAGLPNNCPSEMVAYCKVYNICFRSEPELALWKAMHGREMEIDALMNDPTLGELSDEERRQLQQERDRLSVQRDAMRQSALERGTHAHIRDKIGGRMDPVDLDAMAQFHQAVVEAQHM